VRSAVVASLNLLTGIRVKGDLVVLPDDEPFPGDEAQPFACSQARSLARVHLRFGRPIFQVPKIMDALWNGFNAGFHHAGLEQALTDPRLLLACRLFIDSHFEASDEARLVSLIGVLEV
jgi:hypothetical protein